MKITKKHFFIIFIYAVFLLLYYYVLSKYGMGTSISNIRYYYLFAMMAFVFAIVLLRKNYKEWYAKELLLTIALGGIFLYMSYNIAKDADMNFSLRTYVQTFLIVGPAIYAFSIINIFDIKSIVRLMKISLVLTICGYFMESVHSIPQFFVLNNWLSINIFSSTGNFMESSICAEVFLQLFFFFYYFRNLNFTEKEKKSLNKYMILSFIFTIMSFKRLAILCCLCLFIGAKFIDFNKEVSNKRYIITALIFCVITYFYTKFVKGEIFTNVDVTTFTTGRNYILYLWKLYNYKSFGFGTSLLVVGRYLEMDLVQIYMEMGFLALFLFVFTYFRIANKNNYSYIIMLYSFFNMLTASSLQMSAAWIIIFITVATISSRKIKDEGYEYSDFTFRFRM